MRIQPNRDVLKSNPLMKHSRFALPALLLVAATAAPAATVYIGGGGGIPDGAPGDPLVTTINVADSYLVQSVSVTLTLSHTWVGDLTATLQHGTTTIDLFRRVGKPLTGSGYGSNTNLDGAYTFDDDAGTRLVDAIGGVDLVPGTYRATTNTFNGNAAPTYSGESIVSLDSAFGGWDVTGDWILRISDDVSIDAGTLTSWSLGVTAVPEPASLLGVAALLGSGVFFRSRRPAARC